MNTTLLLFFISFLISLSPGHTADIEAHAGYHVQRHIRKTRTHRLPHEAFYTSNILNTVNTYIGEVVHSEKKTKTLTLPLICALKSAHRIGTYLEDYHPPLMLDVNIRQLMKYDINRAIKRNIAPFQKSLGSSTFNRGLCILYIMHTHGVLGALIESHGTSVKKSEDIVLKLFSKEMSFTSPQFHALSDYMHYVMRDDIHTLRDDSVHAFQLFLEHNDASILKFIYPQPKCPPLTIQFTSYGCLKKMKKERAKKEKNILQNIQAAHCNDQGNNPGLDLATFHDELDTDHSLNILRRIITEPSQDSFIHDLQKSLNEHVWPALMCSKYFFDNIPELIKMIESTADNLPHTTHICISYASPSHPVREFHFASIHDFMNHWMCGVDILKILEEFKGSLPKNSPKKLYDSSGVVDFMQTLNALYQMPLCFRGDITGSLRTHLNIKSVKHDTRFQAMMDSISKAMTMDMDIEDDEEQKKVHPIPDHIKHIYM